MISYYAASQGLNQAELDSMNFLESDMLQLTQKFKPLQSSSTQSGDGSDGGAPEKDMEDLTESGEQNREDS
jgi:hypothetical protein